MAAKDYVPVEALQANAAIELPFRSERGRRKNVSREERYIPPRPTSPWERQPGESARSYRAFSAFRDAGETRQVMATSREMHETARNMYEWARAWKWQERVAAWEQEVDRRKTQAALRAIEKMSERHVNIAMRMQQRVVETLTNTEDQRPLSNRDVDRWLEKAVRIERAARGINDGPRVAINVSQQQAQQQAAAANVVTDAQRTIAEIIATDPSLLTAMNGEVDGLLELADGYSTRNEGHEPVEVVPGDS